MTDPIKIKIKLHEGATMPEQHGEWVDLFTAEEVVMKAGDKHNISLGVSMKLPEAYYAHVLPRSSTCGKYNIIMHNSMGVIENSYCGNDDIWRFPALAVQDTIIPKGVRLCQFTLEKRKPKYVFEAVEEMDDPNRGGFGSTGE